VGTRYLLFGVRTFVNPDSADDLKQAHAMPDAIKIEQAARGTFQVPKSRKTSRNPMVKERPLARLRRAQTLLQSICFSCPKTVPEPYPLDPFRDRFRAKADTPHCLETLGKR